MTHFGGRSYCGRGRSFRLPAATRGEEPAGGPGPTHDEIARRAYSYWEARGRQGGSSQDDWLRAERELKAQRE